MHSWRSWCFSRRGAVALLLAIILIILLLSGNAKREVSSDGSVMAAKVGRIPESSPSEGLSISTKDSLNTVKGAPRLRYAVVMDAGSTGTRIHIYSLMCDADGQVQRLLDEVFHEIGISLGSLASSNQTDKIDTLLMTPLLQLALQTVPVSCQAETPICLKATAGLRLLPAELAEVALETVRSAIQKYPFSFTSPSTAVSIISGREEGIWAWLTVNFLLLSQHDSHSNVHDIANQDAPSTAGIMDLGGASTQLVFEIDAGDALYLNVQRNMTCSAQPDSALCALLSDLLVPVVFAGHTYTLYQHSFLPFGLMEVRKRLNLEALSKLPEEVITQGPSDTLLIGASQLPSSESQVRSEGPSQVPSQNALSNLSNHTSQPLSFSQLEKHVKSLFQLDVVCSVPPCAFGGIPLPPSIHQTGTLYAFSYFYDRLTPHFPGLQHVPLQDLVQLVSQQCSSTAVPPGSSDPAANHKNSLLDWNCLDLMYIKTLLLDAYGLSPDRHVTLAKKINGFETCWALGAAIHILSNPLE